MHIRIERTAFMHAVQRCLNIVDKRVTHPCLANILLVVESDRILMMATNVQITMQVTLQGEVLTEGSTTVDAKKLHHLLREYGDVQQLELLMNNKQLELRSGYGVMSLNTIDASDYPLLSQLDEGLEIDVDAAILSEMIASTQFSMSEDETRQHLTGLLFEVSAEHGLRVVSTDGHRLSFCQTSLVPSPTIEEPCQVIVPAKVVMEIRRMCEHVDQDVHIIMDQTQISLRAADQMMTGMLINARYPLYEEVFPLESPMKTMLPKKLIDPVLRRCLVVANEINHDIRLHFDANAVQITASNESHEQAQEKVVIQYAETPFVMGFNGSYLRDVLSVIHADQVQMAFSDDSSPVVFAEHALGVDKRFVVMPLKIS